jgi:hypothetical protein
MNRDGMVSVEGSGQSEKDESPVGNYVMRWFAPTTLGRQAGLRGALIAITAVALLLISASQAWAIANVTVVKAGAGAAASTVTSNPAGIDCGSECGPKQYFSPVSLTATAGAGFVFSGWSGATCTGGPQSNPCELPPEPPTFPDRTITATFILPPDPPDVATAGTTEVNTYLNALHGSVNPNEFAVSECRFEYGTTAAYGTGVPCTPKPSELGAGNAPVAVSGETEPLEAHTTYHYRLVASNIGGSDAGEDRTFTTGAAPPAGCNGERRAEQGIAALLLPACMALEMVSPPQKSGQPAVSPSVSADGDRVLFFSVAPLGETSGVLKDDAYVASRDTAGWQTRSTVPPGQFPRGWGFAARAESFSPDFSSWFHFASTFSQFDAGIGRASRGSLSGAYEPLSPLLVPPYGAAVRIQDNVSVVQGVRFEGASADHSHLYLAPPPTATYRPGDPVPAGAAADDNVYVAALDPSGEPSLQLLARDSDQRVWGGRCGARIGGNKQANTIISRNQGAVSADGSRTYFSTRADQPQEGFCVDANKMRILVRTENVAGGEVEVQIEELFESECDRVDCSTADGDDRFQGASVDGTKVYFTTTRQLANSDEDATVDLYLYDSERLDGQQLIQVSAGGAGDATPGKDAKVQGNIVALATDGSRVYFVAHDVLTSDQNPVEDSAEEGEPNLYSFSGGATEFVGTLASADATALWGNLNAFQGGAYPVPASVQDEAGQEIGGDGRTLLLQSRASLTANDVDGGRLDVFRYASVTGALECISCKQGGPDAEPFDVAIRQQGEGPLRTDFAERGRWVSEDGETVVFTTAQPLLPPDGNEVSDFFVWREGELYRLPGRAFVAQNPAEVSVPTLSHDGDEIAFQTGTALLPVDGDNAPDIYVARIGGGFPHPVAPEPCQIDESLPGVPCQNRVQAPVAPLPVSDAPASSGNVARCGFLGGRAQKLGHKAKRLRRNSKRVNDSSKAKAMRREARGMSKRAAGLSRKAKRCRHPNRSAGR